MGAPKLKNEVLKKVSAKKPESHLKLLKTTKNSLDSKLAQRAKKNIQEKNEIAHYQEVIGKSLDDPDMIKKAAMLLISMLEK